jgi:hypothetical protein
VGGHEFVKTNSVSLETESVIKPLTPNNNKDHQENQDHMALVVNFTQTFKKKKSRLSMVVHIYNPSHLKGGVVEESWSETSFGQRVR